MSPRLPTWTDSCPTSRFNAVFPAHFKEDGKGYSRLRFETSHVPAVEVRTAIQTYELASVHPKIGVVTNDSPVGLNLDHVRHGFPLHSP